MIRLLQLRGALIIAFLLVIIVSMNMVRDTTCIYAHPMGGYHEKFGIVGIEVCRDKLEWDRFFAEGCPPRLAGDVTLKKDRADYLRKQIELDFLFIGAYGLFLILMCIILFQQKRKLLVLSVVMTLMIVALDCLENIFLMNVVDGYMNGSISKEIIANLQKEYFFSMIKWTTLFLLIILLAWEGMKRWKIVKPLVYLSLILILIFIWQPDPASTWNYNLSELVLGWMFLLLGAVFVRALLGKVKKYR